jgi:hypothetical protein
MSASFINPATGMPWRTEVRGCLLSRSRLMRLLPLPAATAEPSGNCGAFLA